MRPPPPRPPDLFSPSTRLFSGRPLWSSERSTSTSPRRDGEVGLKCFRAISGEPRRDVDGLPLLQGHDPLLAVRAPAGAAAEALGLTLLNQGVDLGYLDLEQFFNGDGDLFLGGVQGYLEHNLVL